MSSSELTTMHKLIGVILSGIIALITSWLLLEVELGNLPPDAQLDYVLLFITFSIPVGLTAMITLKSDLSPVTPVLVGVAVFGVLGRFIMLEAEPIWVLLLLFTIPAFVAGLAQTGLLSSILMTYAPVFGILFAVPVSRLGEPSLVDRVMTGLLFGLPFVLIAAILYLLGHSVTSRS